MRAPVPRRARFRRIRTCGCPSPVQPLTSCRGSLTFPRSERARRTHSDDRWGLDVLDPSEDLERPLQAGAGRDEGRPRSGRRLGLLDRRQVRLAGDQPRSAAAGGEAPRPADDDDDPVSEADQIGDVDAEPEQPGDESALAPERAEPWDVGRAGRCPEGTPAGGRSGWQATRTGRPAASARAAASSDR